MFPAIHTKVAKMFWQHSGDGISSRRAEYCFKEFENGRLYIDTAQEKRASGSPVNPPSKGPRRYRTKDSQDLTLNNSVSPAVTPAGTDGNDCVRFVEERFGRNLDISLAASAKLAIRRRIAGALMANVDLQEALEISQPPTRTRQVKGFSDEDVFLYPCGMSSIFNTHRTMMACRGQLKSISFGSAPCLCDLQARAD